MSYKTELQGNNTDLQTVLSKVNALPDRLVLPTLKNPAGAENIESGFQAVDGLGNLLTGVLEKVEIIEGSFTGANAHNKTITVDGLKGAKNFILIDCTASAQNLDYTPLVAMVYINGAVKYSLCLANDTDELAHKSATFDPTTGKITAKYQYMYIGYGDTYRYWKW